MQVQKRNGTFESVKFDKITERISNFCDDLTIDPVKVAQQIVTRLRDKISTQELDKLTCDYCASLALNHPDYLQLASRLCMSNHQKNTPSTLLQTTELLYKNTDKLKNECPLISTELYMTVQTHATALEKMIDYKRDFLIDFFGFKTLERAYLLRLEKDKKIIECPQHMWMRVAIGIHGDDLEKIKETYNYLSLGYFTHATPTLFHAGTPRPQMSSCYLLGTQDSVDGIYKTITDCAKISKWAGGIGVHISNIRAKKSYIRGTNGISNGLLPMLKIYNDTARYIDQCITPETIIYTTNGPMEIQHCVSGETKIFTTDGCETINNVLEHSYSGEILHINSIHSFKPLSITPEHPVYCLKSQAKGLNYSTIKNRIAKQLVKPEWIEAKDLTTTDMLIFTKPKYENDDIQLSQSDCYMYGLLLGDGSMNNSSTSCYISLHSTNKLDNLNFIKEYLTKKYVKYFINTENNTSRIRWNKSLALPFRYATLYNENKEKYIHAKWLNLPIEKVKYIVKGLIDSDGCIAKEIVFDTTSLKLVESLRYLLLRMGIPTGGYIRDRIGEKHETDTIENKKISYCLRIPKTKDIADIFSVEKGKFHKFFEHDNLIYTRISDIKKGTYDGTLYDLQLIKTHNYLIHNGVIHNGGGKRKGSFAIYLEPWHADIFEFLNAKKPHGAEEERARDLFYALWIPDLFMRRVRDNGVWSLMCPDQCVHLTDLYGPAFDKLYHLYEKNKKYIKQVPAQSLWKKIIESQIETGTPYMLYKNACNKKSNQKNLGTIKSSNLCVAPETRILTESGWYPIESLQGKQISVWNGESFTPTTVVQTGHDQPLVRVVLDNGTSLYCTEYHTFYIQSSYHAKKPTAVEAKDLKEGMKLIKCNYPVVDGPETFTYPYTHGLFTADGTYQKRRCSFKASVGLFCARHTDYPVTYTGSDQCCAQSGQDIPSLALYGSKQALIKHITYRTTTQPNTDKRIAMLPIDLAPKFKVPINASVNIKLRWFEGYMDGDGCVCRNGTAETLQAVSIHHSFSNDVKLMLQTLGVHSTIKHMKHGHQQMLPNGHGGSSLYLCKAQYRLQIATAGVQTLLRLGFSPHRLVLHVRSPQRSATKFVRVVSSKPTTRRDNTYCFKEQQRGMGMFEGVLLGNCAEIIQYSDNTETAVCNLASIALPKFLTYKNTLDGDDIVIYTKSDCCYCKFAKRLLQTFKLKSLKVEIYDDPRERVAFYNKLGEHYETYIKSMPQILKNGILLGGFTELLEFLRPEFDFQKLFDIAGILTVNLNKIINKNFYPTPEAQLSNFRHRPIGIGVQGLADTLQLMHISFHDDDTKVLNREIFETIYFGALTASLKLAKENGPYETFKGSPLSQGLFQFDLWEQDTVLSDRWDWKSLRSEIMKHGVRNSLLVALMPTASTAQILGNNESFEPYTSNLYTRRTLAGEFTIMNKHLLKDLLFFDLWDKEMKEKLMYHRGSIQNIPEIPQFLKNIYKTSWEYPQKLMIQMAADRGQFIDQSQSFNVFVNDINFDILSKIHFYGWSKGLKTGTYYIRSRAALNSQRFTIDPKKEEEMCEMCSG